MVRHIRLRYDWFSHPHILTEQIIKRRIRESVTAGSKAQVPGFDPKIVHG
jgi:hypothetical protein